MLVLSRRVGERIFFPSLGAYVQVLAVNGGTVRLGIEAPSEVPVLREELQNLRPLFLARSASIHSQPAGDSTILREEYKSTARARARELGCKPTAAGGSED
jgi:carbon storage regulator CsrA